MKKEKTRLNNIEFILLFLLGRGGFARRSEIMKAMSGYCTGACHHLYFMRQREVSPCYTYDHERSVPGKAQAGCQNYKRAKVSIWRLSHKGKLRAEKLQAKLIGRLFTETLQVAA